ncbi:MAG TPA: TM0106 family RecB-like putative nuclease [Thermoanaerobaculia bacterium]|nr:TM0106 family RecB-like putative nuclease [Thermoanaerobaculia bacterium]
MKMEHDHLVLSATDLSNHLACRHLTTLDRSVALGERAKPEGFDPRLDVLRERGLEHEKAYLDHLRAAGLEVLELPQGGSESAAREATLEAMRRGVAVIAQATLSDGNWHGRADVLLRVERPSHLGGWSYEPVDTKLARETRGGTILQLVVYAELLGAMQGRLPDSVGVVTPACGFAPERYRVAEYQAFAARVRRRLEESLSLAPVALSAEPPTYPLPTAHCDVCRWWHECDARWQRDDHPCLVAGIHRSHERELAAWGVATLTAFAELPIPLARPPVRGSKETLERLREQARVQLAARRAGMPVWERLAAAKDRGLSRLPEPSPGDVFLDLEGDPFVGEGGIEYLFGTIAAGTSGQPEYQPRWAIGRAEERAAFEALMDDLIERWEKDPGLHVYHFGAYEPSALKRLTGRYATRGEALDRLLRAERFVDLYAVVTQGMRIGIESYSLKQLEPIYAFDRKTPLVEAGRALRQVEASLELGRPSEVDAELRRLVESYNGDDCRSTLRLRDWLERERAEALAAGEDLPRPITESGEASEKLTEWQNRVRPVVEALLEGVPADPAEHSAEQRARYLLAHCLEFHRREDKVSWWEHFRLAALSEEERYDEPRAIAGLRFVERIAPEGKAKLPIDVYTFTPQEVDRRSQQARIDGERTLGTIESLDPVAGRVEIKKTKKSLDEHPSSVFLHSHVSKGELEESLLRLAEQVLAHGIDGAGEHRAARDLLLLLPPRGCPAAGGALASPGEDSVATARRLVLALDDGVLPIQGPPGAGKTYTGARMIVELARQGRTVGVTAVSHKVIANLLEAAVKAAAEEGFDLRCLQKVSEGSESGEGSAIRQTTKNEDVEAALRSGEISVAAGTAWLWARADLAGAVDVLFVDEAGQMSLADVLAVSPAAKSLVLLGDPQQLEQPIQASHPDGTAVAALSHLLAGRPTLAADRGLFLDRTWRLHPSICEFTSEQFYDGKLHSLPGLESQTLHAPPPCDRSGMYFLPVRHEGNQSHSREEAEAVEDLLEGWFAAGAEWTDRHGARSLLTPEDVLVVVPYNAQIHRLQAQLPAGIRVGTVDKFQGQEAPVVIYSMVSSSPEDAPRGMEFLYSRNRLNVATSRARCACVLVASERLLEPECRTPQQMRLANALCRYVELATRVDASRLKISEPLAVTA